MLEACSLAPRRGKDLNKRDVITGMGLVPVFSKQHLGRPIDLCNAPWYPTRIAAQGFNAWGYADEDVEKMLDNSQKLLRCCRQGALLYVDVNSDSSNKMAANHICRPEVDLIIAGGTNCRIINSR
ncbi:hypothetical protein MLD38_016695 [Melastoma candidum]|uniref:Uncharacterized protein n=1 Tax=Melastoma candidum TaxID=119954 RepID=A0ACB9QNB4_9MYRT|nr:hypothetical protein MLD38_016695 [Melastoma candidum]